VTHSIMHICADTAAHESYVKDPSILTHVCVCIYIERYSRSWQIRLCIFVPNQRPMSHMGRIPRYSRMCVCIYIHRDILVRDTFDYMYMCVCEYSGPWVIFEGSLDVDVFVCVYIYIEIFSFVTHSIICVCVCEYSGPWVIFEGSLDVDVSVCVYMYRDILVRDTFDYMYVRMWI